MPSVTGKPGRPPLAMSERRSVPITIRMTRTELDRLKLHAIGEGIEFRELARQDILASMDYREEVSSSK